MGSFSLRPTLRLRVGATRLRAESINRYSVVWTGESSYTGTGELADTIARLAAELPRVCRRLDVLLEHPPAQLRTLADLPPVKPRLLAALVSAQAGRFFRKNGHALLIDAGRLAGARAPFVRAAAVDERLVDAIAAGAVTAGLRLASVGVAGEELPFSLLPTSERARRARAARTCLRRMTIAAAAVWVGLGLFFVVRLGVERRAVERELAALRGPLASVVAARRELSDAETTVAALAAEEHQRGRTLAALAALAATLPDSSVLTSATWRADSSGVLTGIAKRATDLVARLDHVGVLRGARLEGPVVREAMGGREWERFTIILGVDGRMPRERP